MTIHQWLSRISSRVGVVEGLLFVIVLIEISRWVSSGF